MSTTKIRNSSRKIAQIFHPKSYLNQFKVEMSKAFCQVRQAQEFYLNRLKIGQVKPNVNRFHLKIASSKYLNRPKEINTFIMPVKSQIKILKQSILILNRNSHQRELLEKLEQVQEELV